jgi:hypothetical protein
MIWAAGGRRIELPCDVAQLEAHPKRGVAENAEEDAEGRRKELPRLEGGGVCEGAL